MFKLDNAFLEELGLGTLPAVEKNKMLAHIYETLEMRVGMRLAEQMSNEQLDEFESYINRQDEAGALKWLESNFPNYKQVVAEELEKLKGEISQVAPQIVTQSQQNAALSQGQQAASAATTAPSPAISQQPQIPQQPQTQNPTPPPASFTPSQQPAQQPQQISAQPQYQPQQPSQQLANAQVQQPSVQQSVQSQQIAQQQPADNNNDSPVLDESEVKQEPVVSSPPPLQPPQPPVQPYQPPQ
jgi:hypothetical protein